MRLLMFVIGLFFYSTSTAQESVLTAAGTGPDLYLTHVVTPKENYYSVGRLYNFPPREIAAYNSLEFDKGLTLGQTIKIPLKEINFLQGKAPGEGEAVIPVYHIVQAKEGLYRVSVNYNKVPLALLKKWNTLPGDAVSSGTRLIVGYLKVLKDQSPLALQGVKALPVDVAVKIPEDKKNTKKDVAVNTAIDSEKLEKKTNPVIKDKPVDKEVITVANDTRKGSVNFNGGKFKKLYGDQVEDKNFINENGVAGIFKTTSGWQDGKYYCFHNTALPGTIIKITNIANGKSVYAKVLDAIPDIKQNAGLLLRVSNSAAEELGAGDNKFDCTITYSK